MSAFVVVDISVEDAVTYEEYKLLAASSVEKYGGQYIARGGELEVLEGEWNPRRLVLLEFPSMDDARTWWKSPEYTRARKIRERCSTARMILVEGYDPPESEWVHFAWYSTVLEAEMARETLEFDGIPVLVRGNRPGAFGAGFQGMIAGGIELLVPDAALSRARELTGTDEG